MNHNLVKKAIQWNIPIYLLLGIVIIAAFSQLGNTFYQQDEWMGHGHFYVDGPLSFASQYGVLGLIAGGGRLPGQLFQYILFTKYPFNIGLISFFVVVFHFINAILVYHITYLLSKNKISSLIASLFFATTSSSHQAVTWIAASTNTLPSAIFALLSVYLYLKYEELKKVKIIAGSYASLFLSYFTKQSSIFLFIFFPLWHFLNHKFSAKSIKKNVLIHLPLILFIAIIIFPYFTGFFFREHTSENVFTNSNPVSALIVHAVLYPFTSLSQIYFYPGAMFSIAKAFAPHLDPRQIETIGASNVSYVFSLLMIAILVGLYVKAKHARKLLLFGSLFFALSFMPFIALEKGHAYLDSRYYYLGAVGAGILLAGVIESVISIIRKKSEYASKVTIAILTLLFILYIVGQINAVRGAVDKQVALSNQRVEFLNNLDMLYPTLSKNSVVFITGNVDYLVPKSYAPFQQGTGFTLMVWYFPRGNVPATLIQSDYLWELGKQGYKSSKDGGFGYYSDYETLLVDYREGELDDTNIIGIYYDGYTGEMIDISEQLMEKLDES